MSQDELPKRVTLKKRSTNNNLFKFKFTNGTFVSLTLNICFGMYASSKVNSAFRCLDNKVTQIGFDETLCICEHQMLNGIVYKCVGNYLTIGIKEPGECSVILDIVIYYGRVKHLILDNA